LSRFTIDDDDDDDDNNNNNNNNIIITRTLLKSPQKTYLQIFTHASANNVFLSNRDWFCDYFGFFSFLLN